MCNRISNNIFEEAILPLLNVYSYNNEDLRNHISKLLGESSKFYPTSQNIEIFTDIFL